MPSVQAESEYFEPVRPISPGPRSRMQTAPKVVHEPQTNATVAEVTESSAEESFEPRPTSSLPPITESTASPVSKTTLPPPLTVSDLESYPPNVGKVVDLGMDLMKQNLPYKYASADPANGGMDCSGFIYYVLTKSGVKNVPLDAREQYIWVRKAGNFQAVLAQRDDTFELDALRPGDPLFWTNNSGVSRDPEITQTMIYIGRDKATNQRLMIGASERSTYRGEKKSGVSVFDFKLGSAEPKSDEEATSVFVGYGRIPGSPGD
jgi:cell wall-associated NlpC family hydrolase